ncbi:MAG: hypothetical protein E7774_04375 [Bradyrhizobium sp.]|nr:MAG: hypothetical protein E7774_04375 [Bradyrhizobium sp.]
MAELPDDSRAAFGMVLRRADTYVDEVVRGSSDDYAGAYACDTARHTAVNTIIASAKRYEIEPFASMTLPPRKGFDFEKFIEFKVDLDHYAAQLALDNSIRSKRDAVAIEPKVKDRLRQHVHGIKTLIDQADMPEPLRAVLHKRIAEFEAALDKPRVNLVALAGTMVMILAGAANVATLLDSPVLQKLVVTIMTTIGEAKAVDEAKRELPPFQPPQALLAPRPPNFSRPKKAGNPSTGDLDDDIPF